MCLRQVFEQMELKVWSDSLSVFCALHIAKQAAIYIFGIENTVRSSVFAKTPCSLVFYRQSVVKFKPTMKANCVLALS